MGLKIKKAEITIGDKKRVILAKDVVEMGYVTQGLFAIDYGNHDVRTYNDGCAIELFQEDVPDIIEAPKIVEAS